MFPGDVAVDHMLPFHGFVYHPSLEVGCKELVLGLAKALHDLVLTTATFLSVSYFTIGVVVAAPIPFGLPGEDLVGRF
jgi:hypothetical protein